MPYIYSKALNAKWDLVVEGFYIQYRVERMMKTTAILRAYPNWNEVDMEMFDDALHRGIIHKEVKATHYLEEKDDGIYRVFELNNRVLRYKYPKNIKMVVNRVSDIKNCIALPKVFSEYIKNEECPICYDNKSDIMTSCGHHYCNSCFDKLNECAICKTKK